MMGRENKREKYSLGQKTRIPMFKFFEAVKTAVISLVSLPLTEKVV